MKKMAEQMFRVWVITPPREIHRRDGSVRYTVIVGLKLKVLAHLTGFPVKELNLKRKANLIGLQLEISPDKVNMLHSGWALRKATAVRNSDGEIIRYTEDLVIDSNNVEVSQLENTSGFKEGMLLASVQIKGDWTPCLVPRKRKKGIKFWL